MLQQAAGSLGTLCEQGILTGMARVTPYTRGYNEGCTRSSTCIMRPKRVVTTQIIGASMRPVGGMDQGRQTTSGYRHMDLEKQPTKIKHLVLHVTSSATSLSLIHI